MIAEIRDYIWKNRVYFIISLIGLVSFGFMLGYSGHRSLWYDDLYQIEFSGQGQSLAEVIEKVRTRDFQPPLFAVIAMLWLRIAPYGTFWIKLISELAVAVGIVLIGAAGVRAENEKTGILAAALAATSSTLILNCGYTFRPYGFLFLFVSFMVYCYVNRKKKDSRFWHILYTVSILLVAYTHYLGIFVCFTFFLFDLLETVQKKKFRILVPYFVSGICFLPWLLLSFTKVSSGIQSFWPKVPKFTSIYKALSYLASNQAVLLYLFIGGVIYYLVALFYRKKIFRNHTFRYLEFSCVFVVMGILFVYSKFINPKGSVWVNRYILCTLPLFILFLSSCIYSIYQWICTHLNLKYAQQMWVAASLSIVAILGMNMHIKVDDTVNTIYEPFEEAANVLKNKKDIYNEDVLVFSSTGVGIGWNYYLTENGRLPEMNWADVNTKDETDFEKYHTIYVLDVHKLCPMPEDVQELLDKKYEKHNVRKEYSLYKYVKK